jgi:hypothetical protein
MLPMHNVQSSRCFAGALNFTAALSFTAAFSFTAALVAKYVGA